MLKVTDQTALVSLYDSLLLDLDGVLYRGDNPIPHAAEALAAAADQGLRRVFVTNNASRPPEEVAAQLSGMDIPAEVADVVTSAQAGAALVAEQVPSGSGVLAVGGPGVSVALAEVGLIPVSTGDAEAGASVAAVLQGFGKQVSWPDLAQAAYAVAAGSTWVATNTDSTLPTATGIAPGNGTLVDAVAIATGTEPEVVGKPEPPILLQAAAKVDGLKPLVVGDRLNTDILGAANADMASVLVLTGVSGPLELWRSPSQMRPQHLIGNLRGLLVPPLVIERSPGSTTCQGTQAQIVDRRLEVTVAGVALADISEPLAPSAVAAAVWAVAHLAWEAGVLPDNASAVAEALMRRVRK